ncbi:thiamine transport system ATP-binding protein [Actinopolyspora lacussalsi subsp. righensis]|uniref:ABC-type quaternary amine transporter n=1 Tax=Actinopolyspora righensis TaxID=995060 RepID=A0A1I7AG11_9ACTN|nr:ABC transporter ATP-binding protein [Actinopolyspora righensis]SFT73815.1 thiamine transport system ATP-binding protein [Actinopolyspora righensis]
MRSALGSRKTAAVPENRREPDDGLRLEGLTVRYGGTTALSGVHLHVPRGEVLAVLGPSGCGKTTLLRSVAGLERPSEGRIAFDGVELSGVPVHRRGFGMVFQDGQLFGHRDVAGNVDFALRMRSVGRRERRETVARLLELVGLAGYQDRRVTELSGGQAQRVALARALAAEPRLLLLDEPLSGLDRMLRERLAVDLARVLDRNRMTGVLVTHDHDEAFTLADRIAVLVAGRIEQLDTPWRLWHRPATEGVARFLGCGTILSGLADEETIRCEIGTLPRPSDCPVGTVRIGLRSAGLRAAPAGEEAPAGQSRAVVRERVHRHDHVRLTVTVPDAPRLEPLEAVTSLDDVPHLDEEVTLTLEPNGTALITEEFRHEGKIR